jgi:orotidine-5'-phosphate decarboxylase
MGTFFDRLEAARRERATRLCVGIDPRLEAIPTSLRRAAGDSTEATLTRFGREVVALTAAHAACIKVQIAFFEAHGLAGMRAYAEIVGEARARGVPVIGDVKRGDIGSTAEAYATAHLAPGSDFEVDAITVNPWLGSDALEPFVAAAAAAGKGVYVLVRTSNPGSADLQALAADGRPVYDHVVDVIERVEDAVGVAAGATVGAVVGATQPEAGRALRLRLPDTPFLVPGYGAQGGTADAVARLLRADGGGVVVNASRSIIHPSAPEGRWSEAVATAASSAREDLRVGR